MVADESPSMNEPLVLHRNDRFEVVVLDGQRPRLVLHSEWHPTVGEYMREHGIGDLSLNTGMGWTGGGIEFLRDAPPLRSLALLDWRTDDLTPLLAHATSLHELVLECRSNAAVVLGQLPALKILNMTWERAWDGFLDGRPHGLQALAVQGWPYSDLAAITPLMALEELAIIKSRRLIDLSALRGRNWLRELVLYQCRPLTDFEAVSACTGLRKLELGTKVLRRLDLVSGMHDLEMLILGPSDVATLSPLEACSKLRRFGLAGRVEDADLSVCLRLPVLEWVAMRDRKEYRPGVAEVNKVCSPRWRA
jgi:hypothetical protein